MPLQWNINSLATFVSLGGFFWGMDTDKSSTVAFLPLLIVSSLRLIGPVTVMPQFLKTFPEAKNMTIQGTLVATILMAAALSSLTSGSVSDHLSRKRTIMIGAIVGAIGCFIEASAVKLWMLIVGRLIAGMGEGWFLNTISVYLVEISPPAVRGRTACTLQLLITIGITVGYFICYFSVSMPSSMSFRVPFLVQGIACSVLALGTPFIPYSPRWLATHGREEEAWAIIAQFDPEGVDHQKEKIQNAIQMEKDHRQALQREQAILARTGQANGLSGCMGPNGCVGGNVHLAAVKETFHEDIRGRTVFGIVFMGLQQLSGIDGVLFYAPVLFAQAGLSTRKASFLASGVSGIINMVSTIPAQFYLVDKWGRRPTCITGGLVMGFCMSGIGTMYASNAAKEAAGRWVVVVLIYIFVAAFAMTWSVAGKILTTEMQPSRTRATASSLAQTSNWLVNVVVALTTPLFLSKSPSGPYFMFGGFLLFTSMICVLWAPETLGRTLEDIDAVWHERTRQTQHLLHLKRRSDMTETHEYLRRHHGDIKLSSTIGVTGSNLGTGSMVYNG